MGVSQNSGYLLGVLIIRIRIFWVLYWGLPILETTTELCNYRDHVGQYTARAESLWSATTPDTNNKGKAAIFRNAAVGTSRTIGHYLIISLGFLTLHKQA